MTVDSLNGTKTDAPIMITDPYADGDPQGNHMGYLRSLPYLLEQGVDSYTFSQHWLSYGCNETFDEVVEECADNFRYNAIPSLEFKYNLVKQDTDPEDIEFPILCQYVSQEMEQKQSKSTVHQVLRAYERGNIPEFFMVIDTPDFKLEKYGSSKPLAEELEKVYQISYEKIAQQHIRENIGDVGRKLDTLNVWLHNAAEEYTKARGTKPSRIADLFDFYKVPTNVRTWDVLEFLASDVTESDSDHIQATIRPWVEKDITIIKTHIHNILQEFDYDSKKVREYRESRAKGFSWYE